MTTAINASHLTKLNRVLQLASANLPVGSFTFSQGLETAIEREIIHDTSTCEAWLISSLEESLAMQDLPIIKRLMEAVSLTDAGKIAYWNEYLLAARETSELKLTDTMTGKALVRLLCSLDDACVARKELLPKGDISFCTAYALACSVWDIAFSTALYGYTWAYLDNQLAAATKLIPLGQTDNQKLLMKLGDGIEPIIEKAMGIEEDDIGGSQFMLAMASSWHETQYSRLFRS